MTLVEIIRKSQSTKPATATPATAPTKETKVALPVARVATVAVAPLLSEVLPRASTDAGEDIAIEPASPTARPIYWEGMDGTWHGPVKPEYLGRTGKGRSEQFWVVVNDKGIIRWIWAELLRSRRAFLARNGMGA